MPVWPLPWGRGLQGTKRPLNAQYAGLTWGTNLRDWVCVDQGPKTAENPVKTRHVGVA
jgi:hypothetical protein